MYNLLIYLQDLIDSLNIGWKSMLYLFLAMFLMFATVLVLNKLTNRKNK